MMAGGPPSLGSLQVVTQSESLTQYEKEKKEQQLTSAPQQVIYLPGRATAVISTCTIYLT